VTRDITKCPPSVFHITKTVIRARAEGLCPNNAIDIILLAFVHKTVPRGIYGGNFLPLKDVQGVDSSGSMSV
jgi:hypothetical protein